MQEAQYTPTGAGKSMIAQKSAPCNKKKRSGKMNAMEIINEWNSLAPEKQINFCMACVRRVINDGFRLMPGYDLEDAVHSTYIATVEKLQNPDALDADSDRRIAAGKAPNTLAAVICRAAKASIQSQHRQYSKHAVAGETDEDGKEVDRLATIPAPENTEATAVLRIDFRQFISDRDEIDQKIIAWRMHGLTSRQIAVIVGVSPQAISKRLLKIKTALREIL
jgi:RNA polymerase sigma factor (sigma-70 family)